MEGQGRASNMGTIFGRSWEEIQSIQQGGHSGKPIDTKSTGDYGSDPYDGEHVRMVPSGDIVTIEECNRRLGRAVKV